MKVQFNSFALSHSDHVESDDAYDHRLFDDVAIAVVADGLGGARKSREAAQKTVTTLVQNFKVRPASWSVQKSLEEITRHLNRLLYQESMVKYDAPEMLCTLAVAVIVGDRLCVLNAGDSRIYILRNDTLEQISIDDRSEHEQYEHVLSQAMGVQESISPHYVEKKLKEGDLVFLCSDGISDVLDDPTLENLLRHQTSARSLITHARERATPATLDDMSAIIIQVAQLEAGKASQQRTLEIPETLHPGQKVDDFTLVRELSANARTWLAGKGSRQFVLKFAPLAARDNDTILTAFIREMWNASRLHADFFVPAFIPDEGTMCYYAMEYVEAKTLKEHLAAGPLKVDEAVALARFLLQACQHLLRLDFVHADIKPENVLVLNGDSGLAFKLIDYGSISEIFSVSSRAGTPSYLAPERYAGSAISERTEIFAIGVTTYHAVTGRFPYGETEPFQTPSFTAAKKPSQFNANLPGWFESILLRSIAIDPEQRYQNYSEMEFELAHPDKVKPYFRKDAPLLERNPLLFYKAGFFIFLAFSLYLLFRLLNRH